MDARRESEGKKTTGASQKKKEEKEGEKTAAKADQQGTGWHVSGHNHTRLETIRVEGALHKRLTSRPLSGGPLPSRTRRTMQVAGGIGSESTRAANCDRPAKRAMKQFGMRQGWWEAAERPPKGEAPEEPCEAGGSWAAGPGLASQMGAPGASVDMAGGATESGKMGPAARRASG
ncbi:hypothetical protein TgHK011_002670 [Trichoderma gracile]|nr:hypothetical protein TgHK011_002670 [Trichoderma gracile]